MEATQITDQIFGVIKSKIKTESVSITLVSNSMEPILKVGNEYRVEPIQYDNIKRFDILVFRKDDVLIAHCVTHVNTIPDFSGNRTVVTCGINNKWEDYPVLEKDILGLIDYKIPFGIKAKLILPQLFRF